MNPQTPTSFYLFLLSLLRPSTVPPGPTSRPLQCIDESGSPVDWYIVYKLPRLSSDENDANLFGGFRYGVLTSAQPEGWRLSSVNISQAEQSIFGQTLAPVFSNDSKTELSTLFYSDQPPGDETASSYYAHAKGALVSDEKQGFWLIHTIPRFTPDDEFVYPSSGGRYGQVAMCISLDSESLARVVEKNFLTAKVYPYHTSIADASSPLGKALKKLENHEWASKVPYSDMNLTSLEGTVFRSFYKSPGENVDLYAGIVAPAVHSSLLVETWRRNPGTPLESECSLPKEKVENVAQINVSFVNSEKTGVFEYSNDHSKWAISSQASSTKLVCIGDINRMESQFKRGGGTTCLAIPTVWKAFQSFVGEVEACGGA